MENILELLYDKPARVHEKDSPFVNTAKIRNEYMELLTDSMTDEQKDLLEAYFEADDNIDNMMNFDRFQYAFHLGAQFMAEIIEGRGKLLNQ